MHFLRKQQLKILLRLPNWLGDSAMVSPAFESLKMYFINASFTLVGSEASCGIYRRDSRVDRIIIDRTKIEKHRFQATKKLAARAGKHDIAILFTNTFYSALFVFMTKTPIRVGYGQNLRSIFLTHKIKFIKNVHQVLLYQNLVNNLCNTTLVLSNNLDGAGVLKLVHSDIKGFVEKKDKINIGINPGAAYGSAKRWSEQYFLEVMAYFLQNNCRIFLFGNAAEVGELGEQLTSYISYESESFVNLVGKTTIEQLCDYIASMDLFITNDSGPMHIAASFNVPLVAIFGPTDTLQTSPWKSKAIILDKKLPCAPCKKRVCPLKHHNCMKLITPDEVISSAKILLQGL